jgi:hypothetical protein
VTCSDPHYFKKYYQKHKVKKAAQGRFRRYGITAEKFEELFQAQGRCCFICKTTEPAGVGWAVDHDHVLNTFRGILCNRCNTVLGMSRDNPAVLRRAAQYLELQQIAY